MPSVMEKKEKGHPIFLSADARRRGGACLAGGGFRGSRGGFRAGFRGALRAVVVAGAVLLAGGAGDLVRAQSPVCNAALGEVDDGNGNCACPSGQTGTSGNGNSSGKCVADGTALAAANNCESAGWQLNDARTHCEIRSLDRDIYGTTHDRCVLSGGINVNNEPAKNAVSCESVFSDRDDPADGVPDFPAYNAALDGTTARVFFNYCAGGQHPVFANTAGQTQCCAPPLTDHDMNPGTDCNVADAPIVPVTPVCNAAEGEILNRDKTGCVCNPATHTGTPAEGCAAGWTVNLETTGDGALRAAWSGDDDVRDGEAVPRGATVTFTATPEGDYYVAFWTGCARTEGNTGDSEDRESKECAVVAESDLSVGAYFQREAACGFTVPRTATFGDNFRTAIQRDGECFCPPYSYDTLYAGGSDSFRICLPMAGGVGVERAGAILAACKAAGYLSEVHNRFSEGTSGALYWVQTCNIYLNNLAIADGVGSGYTGCVIGAEPEFTDFQYLERFGGSTSAPLSEKVDPLARRPNCVDVFPNLRNAGGSFPTGYAWANRVDDPAYEYGTPPDSAAACEVDGSCPERTVSLESGTGGTLDGELVGGFGCGGRGDGSAWDDGDIFGGSGGGVVCFGVAELRGDGGQHRGAFGRGNARMRPGRGGGCDGGGGVFGY